MEVLDKPADRPSSASGFTRSDLDSDFDEPSAIYWLIEDRRNPVVTKYSGTMVHPSNPGRREQTISTFAHFAWKESGFALVFADIQGMPPSSPPLHMRYS